MAAALIPSTQISPATMEKVLIQGNLASLSAAERLDYYRIVCDSVGLNPLTKPFEYLALNGKLVLYATRNCTDQLRQLRGISISIKSREVVDGCYAVTAQASTPQGRADESIGAVLIEGLKGEARANALMKGETKSKRRVTLSICGLSMMDETEVETVPDARRVTVDERGEVSGTAAAAQAVAERKITELRRQPAVELAEAIPEAYEPDFEQPSDLEQDLHESIVMADRLKAGRETKGADHWVMLRVFGELKTRYQAVGFERTYYAILARYGVKHSNEFPDDLDGRSTARCCYKELSLDLANREARATAQREVR